VRIDKTQKIAGIPVITVRDFLVKVKDRLFTGSDAIRFLKTDHQTVTAVLAELHSCKYIELLDFKTEKVWEVTTAGRTFSIASAAKPILRKTADKKIEEFLKRVEIVNSSNHYIYEVVKVVVFGSYLSEQEKINDIDIGFALERKTTDGALFEEMHKQSIRQAEEDGRYFSTHVERIFWPEREIQLFLKSRSRSISLHPLNDGVIKSAVQKVLFEKPQLPKQ
jgi:predicted nucleotidyltransferase